MAPDFKALGFPYSDSVIMTFIGGSQLHGAKLEGTDDTDWYGIFIEPPEKIIGIDSYEHFVYSTSTDRYKNNADDLDVTLYSLRKWAGLACKGNPSVLHFLFAHPQTWHNQWLTSRAWETITSNASKFIAKSHLGAFFGYANAQLQRLYNGRGPKNVSRPFLEDQYGYDTKYAMHIIRLLDEARELMEEGKITLPRPNAEFLKSIRRGEIKLYEIEKLADDLQQKAKEAEAKSQLPANPDRKEVSKLVAKVYQTVWSGGIHAKW
jgi:predicted nucleotidyltransferase